MSTENEKLAASARFNADIVDMESYTVASCAQRANLPAACVRIVVDPAWFSLPHAARLPLGVNGRPALGALTSSLLRHPLELPELIKLGTWYKRALARLTEGANLIGETLAFPTN